MTETTQHLGTGRRKTAIARVRLSTGTGKILVNGRAFNQYFPLDTLRMHATQPLITAGVMDKVDVKVNVTGGGPTGQAGAVRLGIARALLRQDGNLRPVLKAEGLLTRDAREKERKKYGQPGARKRYQFSKR
ncbi:MAG TPA: 30S ribosomal protein S9 [Verrucomicrobiota bacterium]|jgi:small subunit ribosomal protein S9|nr:30S ribosomal protein S9 [Verrucomicrobiota bacterium]OQB88538.1 MAG: 30S ribosomal protein S9 [Verrucomicrobia bacterium ADurb.Bin118]HPY31683.1 30S ribosomal protein S9 [Verrucomicrobiota bacterium]HQB17795.1 30S ribosomal protein S9 [Verrucomicrobiota bacterium]